METKPTHEQAQLHLQLFEQRREARLRQARDWFFKNYLVENLDDAMRIAAPGTEGGTFRNDGAGLLGPGLRVAQLWPALRGSVWTAGESWVCGRSPRQRCEDAEKFHNQQYLGNLERDGQRDETWIEKRSPGHVAAMRGLMKQMRSQTVKAA